jgi:hypothetical protein
MRVVREQLNFSNAAVVFFQVTDQLTATYLPDTDIALHASTAEELAVTRQFDCCNAILVGVVYLPKQLAVVNSECANFSI